jgi:hypothetical protein
MFKIMGKYIIAPRSAVLGMSNSSAVTSWPTPMKV